MNTTIIVEDSWKNDSDTSRVIKFYVDIENPTTIKDTFSYIYESETDEIEFSFEIPGALGNLSVPIYYTVNGRDTKTEITSTLNEKYKVATIMVEGDHMASTVIARIPAYKKIIREDYQFNKSKPGLISPNDYNPTLGSNFYKNQGDNSYITKDTYEDYIRSSNIEGHPLDEVGRRQVLIDKGYYKIYKTLKIKCNQLERTVDSDGNYYSSDRSTNFYVISGVYTYDLYDSEKNLIRENVPEITPHISMFNTTINKRAFNPSEPNKPVLGKVFRLDDLFESYNHTYVGQLFYEDFDGTIKLIQSENHITLEKFVAVDFGTETGTPVYWENDYPLYIVGPNKGDFISFNIQIKGEERSEQIGGDTITWTEYPDIIGTLPAFSNPDYKKYFDIESAYTKDTGKLLVTITAKENNNDDDPWRPSYARVLPSLEKTTFSLYFRDGTVDSLTAVYYVIQKSSKIGIIPKKYISRESINPIDLDRDDYGRYLLKISEGIGVKIAYLGITSEVDPYDRDIVRNWAIREDMSYTDETGNDKIKEREYFFENYTGKFEDKIVFITGAYDGQLSPFKIRDFIDRSDIWRQAIYESEVTVVPIIDNIDKTVDLGGGWSYTLDTATNYFIGTNLLYLFNENNRYYTQRFNLEFSTPEHTGPSFSNFKASINDISLLEGSNRTETYNEEDGVTYTFYDNPVDIHDKLFGTSDTARTLVDREKDSETEIEVKKDDNYVALTRVANKYIPLTFLNTGCEALDSDTGDPLTDGDGTPLYIPLGSIDTGWEAMNPLTGLPYSPKKYVNVTTENTGYPAIDPETGKQKVIGEVKYYLKTTSSTVNPDYYNGWQALDPDTKEPIAGKHVVVTETNTGYPTIGGNQYYLDLTTTDTGYAAFSSLGDRLRNTSNVPMFLTLTDTDTGWEAIDLEGRAYSPAKYVNVTSTDSGYPAYSVVRHKYVDKYKTLVEIKSSKRKRLFFCFEDIVGRTVKFDMIYPQDSNITTRDIEQIPTVSPLKFVFKLIETGAVYELQEIRFYCGIEGVQPLKLLSNSEDLYPDPSITNYTGYPEVELKESSSKFNVISETYSDAFPDWELITAYSTFNYSSPNGNKIVVVNDSNGIRFSESDSYLQIDYKDQNGGSDFIDFIRVKEGNLNWWNDWRFFVYNKFTNRFSLYCSSGSPELELKDINNQPITTINFDKIGLYRIHISTKNQGVWKKLTLTQTSARVNSLYTVDLDNTGSFFGSGGGDADKLIQGHVHRGDRIEPNVPVSIKTVTGGQERTSLVLYLWYEGCSYGEDVKSGGGRLEFELTFTSGEGGEVTFKKSISVLQTPSNGNFGDHDKTSFFDLTSYKFLPDSNSVTGYTEHSYGYGNRKFPVENFVLGFPIFNAVPGKVAITHDSTYPYKLGIGINRNEDDFLKTTEIYQIDSPKTSADYNVSGDALVEEGCYIVGSFIGCTYEFKTDTYGKTAETWERDDFYNQPRRFWTITFTDGRGKTFSNTLFYDSPIDVNPLEIVSLGAKNTTYLLGRSGTNFVVNAGIDRGTDNDMDPENVNTFYYEYNSDSQTQVLKFPRKDIERLVIKESDPIQIHLLKDAVKEDGTEASITSNIESVTGTTLNLISNATYPAFKWSNINKKDLTLDLFTDSNSGSTNVPLELLSLFGNNLTDNDKTVGWITTARAKFNLEIEPPTGMTPEDFKVMMTSSDLADNDSGYPHESLWFGLGQRLVSNIKVSSYTIKPSSSDGMGDNPRFIIPLSWFNNSGGNQSHTIEITINSDNPESTAESLIFGAEIRKKGSSSPFNNVYFGEVITSNPTISYNGRKATISFSATLNTDIVVVPKFTNIEHDCFKNFVGFGRTPGPRASTSRYLQAVGINSSASQSSANIALTPSTGTGTGAVNLPKTNSDSFLGFRILDHHQNRQYLNLEGRLDYSSFSLHFMQTITGYPVEFGFKVDGKDQRNSTVSGINRKGYGKVIFIQPGHFFQKPHYDHDLNQQTLLYINWYSFRISNNSVEGTSYVTTYDESPREVFILYPERTNVELRIALSRGAPTTDVSTNPSQGSFFIQELTIPIYEMGYFGGYTYSGKQENTELTILGDFNNDIDSSIHPNSTNSNEYYRLVNRKGYQFYPGAGGGNGGGTGPQDIVRSPSRAPHAGSSSWGVGEGPGDDIHPAANIMGPYPSPSMSGNNKTIIQIKKGITVLYNLIITG